MGSDAKPLTPQQTTFAHALATGMSQADAYRKAYPNSLKWADSSVWPKASQLAKDPRVVALVSDLQERASRSAMFTLADHLKRLDEISRAAQKADDFNAAARAEEARGKAAGFYVQKMEHTGKDGGPIETKQTRDLTDDELAAALRAHGIEPGTAGLPH